MGKTLPLAVHRLPLLSNKHLVNRGTHVLFRLSI